MACMRRLLRARPRLYPQFATHNALTVATVIEEAGGVEGYEFQRLHGMGEVLYEALLDEAPGASLPGLCAGRQPSRSARLSGAAAPGERRQFLVRGGGGRSERADRDHPQAAAGLDRRRRPRPASQHSAAARSLPAGSHQFLGRRVRRSRRAGGARQRGRARDSECGDRRDAHRWRGIERAHRAPCSRRSIAGVVGQVTEGDAAAAASAMAAAQAGFPAWAATPVERRAEILERAAELLEGSRGRLIALMQVEGGKTLGRRARRGARSRGLLPLLCRAGAPRAQPATDAGTDRRVERAPLSRSRRVRLHQPVEFPAGDFSRPGDGGARCRQHGGGEARRADAADRGRRGAASAPSRRAGGRAASGAGRRQGRGRAHLG